MPEPIRIDKFTWKVDFYRNKKRIRRLFHNEQQAQDFIDGKLNRRRSKPITLPAEIHRYLVWAEQIKRKSPKSIRGDVQRLTVFQKWADGKARSAAEIDVDTIRGFQEYYFTNAGNIAKPNHRLRRSNPAATWEKYRQILSAFLNWCVDRRLTKKNPISRAKEFLVKAHKPPRRRFTPDETRRLLVYFENIGTHVCAFFAVLAYTGIRLSEAIDLRRDNVDLDHGMIQVEQTKNYEPRSVPINDRLAEYLKALPGTGTYLFDNGTGHQLYSSSYWWKMLRNATDALKMKPAQLHSFRHTFGSELAEADVNIKVIQDLMGHKRIETTLIYLTMTEKKKRESVAKLPY